MEVLLLGCLLVFFAPIVLSIVALVKMGSLRVELENQRRILEVMARQASHSTSTVRTAPVNNVVPAMETPPVVKQTPTQPKPEYTVSSTPPVSGFPKKPNFGMELLA
ncbi:MAG TPA: hypothetical protein VIR63_00220 [Pontiella sp.]